MQRAHLLILVIILMFISGLAVSQSTSPGAAATAEATPQIAFAVEGEIGRALPRKIVYDPQRERMAVVDAYSRLLLISAVDYSTLVVLHERGEYGDIAFSHDGRWLAVAYGITMELWDTETHVLAASLPDLGNARYLLGPMGFSSDDEVLVFYGVYPAPRALRIRETDSITYPWVWHLPAARKEKPSTFPNGLEAVQMVDFANGFVLSPDDRFVAALPSRLRVLDAHTLEPEYEIPTARYEQDPLTVWNSLRDNSVYVRPVTANTLLQVDTRRGVLVEIPMYTDLTANDLALIGGLEFGSIAQVIGGQASRATIPLLQVFLGYYYRDSQHYGNRPLTVTLIDLLAPPANTQDNVLALLFIYDEQKGTGQFQFSASGAAQQMVLSPDGQELLVRRYDGDEYVVAYDLESGQEVRRWLPALRAIGAYSRAGKNRVLAYDLSGKVIISDFQRLEADTNRVLAEDLRYSRRFDRFFFSNDSQKIITLAGTEWREWSIETGQVLRRDVVRLSGAIIATSPDGYRYLTQYPLADGGGAAEVIDMNSGERYTVNFQGVPGSQVAEVYPNPSWTRFLVIYAENPYGPYYPGNQIALYDYREGFKWLVAGDDLPPVGQRRYGWVDEDTVFIYGQGAASSQPARIYGVDYAPDGLPACIVSAYPDHVDSFLRLWERLVYNLRADQLDTLAQFVCGDLPDTAGDVEQLLLPTATPEFVAPTGVPIGETPQCLTARFPNEAEAYAEVWGAITADMSPEDRLTLAAMLCEGIGEIRPEDEFDPSLGVTLFIDAETGQRASGDYQPPVVEQTPLQPIYDLFEKTEKRPLGTAILSPNRELVAASSLPGELVIYRMVVTYDFLMEQLTATADVELEKANLIKALPSPSPTYNPIGTPRPTLTPTPKQTLFPRPQERVFAAAQTEDLCPSERLHSIQNPPASYHPSGRLYAQITGDYLWAVEPEDGSRYEARDIPQCQRGVDCRFSPDNSWILARTYDLIYIVRPDNSDPRILWDLRTPYPQTPVPYDLYWSGDHTLEWEDFIPVTVEGQLDFKDAYMRDVLNVYPDPKPWIPEVEINAIPAQLVSRQPGGPWAVVTTTYNTGLGQGYKYYLYHTGTGQYGLFAQDEHAQISIYWHPLGDRLFYTFPDIFGSPAYQVTFPEGRNQLLGSWSSGVWSNDGRYLAYSTASRAQPIAVLDSQTGETRTYCLPETGARLYQGPFTWSPDNRYVALQAPLPKDEAKEGVGQHTLIVNVETGEVVDLTTGLAQIVAWAQEPGTYGSGRVVTPTPTPSPTPAQ